MMVALSKWPANWDLPHGWGLRFEDEITEFDGKPSELLPVVNLVNKLSGLEVALFYDPNLKVGVQGWVFSSMTEMGEKEPFWTDNLRFMIVLRDILNWLHDKGFMREYSP